jgi:hypothetical protein
VVDGFYADYWGFRLYDSTASVLNDDSAPTSLSISGWDSRGITVEFFNVVGGEQVLVNGIVTAISSVPEPAASALLALGLLGIAGWRRARA